MVDLTQSGLFPHTCEAGGCRTVVQYDDEPYCFTHSPDEGSSVRGYSARSKAANRWTLFSYAGQRLRLKTSAYRDNGALAVIVETTDGEPFATVSCNLPGTVLPPGGFWLKDWSENEGIAKSLIDQRLIEPVEGMSPVHSGFVEVSAYRLVKAVDRA